MATNEQIQSRRLEDVRLILRDFLKVIKVVAMYPEDNPLPQSLRRTFAERLVELVTDYGELDFRVTARDIQYNQETVFTDKSREESLAGLFFETGITRLTFKVDVEVNDVYRLLDALKEYQSADRRTRDLVAGLWEAGLKRISYETVEDVALRQYEGDFLLQNLSDLGDDAGALPAAGSVETYDAIFSDPDDPLSNTDRSLEVGFLPSEEGDVTPRQSVLSTGHEELDGTLKVTEAVAAMGLDDLSGALPRLPDTQLILNDEHKLSRDELELVDLLVRRDAEFSEYESTGELVKEILHQEAEMNDFYESVTIGERILTEFVKVGRLTYAADLLRYFTELQNRLRNDRPLWAERLKEARVTAGSRDRLGVLCGALNENVEIGSIELRRYLDNFDWEALVAITDLLGALQHDHHRESVRDYLTMRGGEHVHVIAKGLQDKRVEVAAASATILARIGSEEALRQLGRVLNHPETRVRRAMVDNLVECPNDACLSLLRQLVDDDDAEIRQAAVSSIVARRGQPAFDAMTEILNDSRFHRLGEADQRAILIAYSKLGGDAAVDYLLQLVEKVNLFKNQKQTFFRKAAFEALAHNRGEKAERALLRLAGSWRTDLKAHARAAMQKRRELVYGGDYA